MFYFILHPLAWADAEDANIIFNAVRLASNQYIVSFVYDNVLLTRNYDTETVTDLLAKQMWVMTDEYGNY